MTALTKEQIDREREAFEARFPDVAIFRELEGYSVHTITKMWQAYLARAEVAAAELSVWHERADAVLRYGKENKDGAMLAVITEMQADALKRAAILGRNGD